MSIQKNAIQAIECGIEDYKTGSDARLKSAICNIHAGVLLLFKQKLAALSPAGSDEVLLKQSVLPVIAGTSVAWSGKGKKTVDVQAIKERFLSLKIDVDWNEFEAINRIRNEIEHYYTAASKKVIQEAIAKSFGLLSDFLRAQLNEDPKVLLSEEAWEVFISVREVYEKEKAACRSSLSNIDTDSNYIAENASEMPCDECGSDLIFVDGSGNAVCRSCGRNWEMEQLIASVATHASAGQNYMSIKDGGDPMVIDCPECGEFAFVVNEMKCAVCGVDQQSECDFCSVAIPISEIDGSGVCGWCNHRMSKDD